LEYTGTRGSESLTSFRTCTGRASIISHIMPLSTTKEIAV
jgi:hypothetical protein